MINALVACEESQATTKELRKLGVNAFSCDIKPCSGGLEDYHIQGDALEVAKGYNGLDWDLMIAHPPCTYLTCSGMAWYYHPEDKHLPKHQRRPHPKHPNRRQYQQEAIDFFLALMNADIKHIAIENPVGILSTVYRKPDCIVQPYHFGDEAQKTTCFWLKNLPPLKHTKVVGKGEFKTDKDGKRRTAFLEVNAKNQEERRTLRSKTFRGMAQAMAKQWSEYAINYENLQPPQLELFK